VARREDAPLTRRVFEDSEDDFVSCTYDSGTHPECPHVLTRSVRQLVAKPSASVKAVNFIGHQQPGLTRHFDQLLEPPLRIEVRPKSSFNRMHGRKSRNNKELVGEVALHEEVAAGLQEIGHSGRGTGGSGPAFRYAANGPRTDRGGATILVESTDEVDHSRVGFHLEVIASHPPILQAQFLLT
jgi:hypothetical protein